MDHARHVILQLSIVRVMVLMLGAGCTGPVCEVRVLFHAQDTNTSMRQEVSHNTFYHLGRRPILELTSHVADDVGGRC